MRPEAFMEPRKKIVAIRPKKKSVTAPAKKRAQPLYDKDFYKWTQEQAALLEEKRFSELDFVNLQEEIQSLGKSDKRALRSQLKRLLMHRLKEKYQPHKQENSRSWKVSIADAETEIKYLVQDSPSLKKELSKIYAETYADACKEASIETGLPLNTFPKKCEWPLSGTLY